MAYESVELINTSGRRVRVAKRRVQHLLRQGYTRPEEVDEADEPDGYSDLSRSDLWALIKERGLDDQIEYSGASADDMVDALEADDEAS